MGRQTGERGVDGGDGGAPVTRGQPAPPSPRADTRGRLAACGAAIRSGVAGAWAALVTRFNRQGLSENAILLGFAVAIGVLTALGVILFYRSH